MSLCTHCFPLVLQSFRAPAYQDLCTFKKEELSRVPVHAMTATATPQDQLRICAALGMSPARTSFQQGDLTRPHIR